MWTAFPPSDYYEQLRLPKTHHAELAITLVSALPANPAGGQWISWVQSCIFINSPAPATPVGSAVRIPRLTLQHSWPTTYERASAHHNNTFFGAITFTI